MIRELTIGKYTFALRTILTFVAIVAIVIAALAIPSCLSKWRSERAQSRVDASQAVAASKSAGDAINTVAASGEREAASEDLTRDNAREIAAADGAADKVKPGVDAAGRAALCRRQAYANDPKCKGVK